ncbi:microtubule-associated protein 1B [Diachasmimorpha longicaudata]|uniref:microtubule-associated protein 1B n=1 Tax=Diachasmimorpha longicaudata TaxID=58733 RepID=UPI0030B8C554
MAMLAEPKRKQRWTLNPRGKQWSEDSNKFGQKMLEKMGWTSGKGLGANEQGMTEHVRVRFKDDAGGIGYSKDDQDKYWTEHQESFNDLLQKLQAGSETPDEKALADSKKSTDLSGKSLELKSKQSRARVHYQKFTRGKDVNKYSTKDLANIFGKKDLKEAPKVPETLDPSSSDPSAPIGAADTTGGVLTIKGGSMSDYFKSKLANFQMTPKKTPRDEEKSSESESERYVGFGFSSPSITSLFSPEKSKSNSAIADNKTPKKRKSEFYVETPKSSSDVVEVNQKNKKLKLLDDSENQKLDFNCPDSENHAETETIENENYSETQNDITIVELSTSETRKSIKKKKKEKLNCECSEIDGNSENSMKEPSSPKKSKKKKKKEITPVECIPQTSPSIPTGNSLEPPKKPPRIFLKAPGIPSDSLDPSDSCEISRKNRGKNCEAENPASSQKHLKESQSQESGLVPETPVSGIASETPKKSKKSKKKNSDNEKTSDVHETLHSFVFENLALELESPVPESPKKLKKSKKKKSGDEKKSSESRDNPQKFVFENPGLDLECPETGEISLEVAKSLKDRKRRKNEEFEGIINPALNLDSKIDENPLSSGFEVSRDPGTSRESSSGPLEVVKKPKRRKKEEKIGHCNPLVTPDSEIDENSRIPRTVEVSREPGVSNDALDLSDEYSCKKRVTFNEEIEYNTDSLKKKKKKMRKLDKFEVENDKLKKKKLKKEGEGSREVVGYVNPILQDEIISEEVIDNEENERKCLKNERKRKRRISNLETIEEIPEEDAKGEGVLGVANGGDDCEIPRKKKKKKSKNKEDQNFENSKENWEGLKEGLDLNIKLKGKEQLEVVGQGRQEILQQNNSGEFFGNPREMVDRSKRKIKSLFMKSPILYFEGSNINDIKGYGVDM